MNISTDYTPARLRVMTASRNKWLNSAKRARCHAKFDRHLCRLLGLPETCAGERGLLRMAREKSTTWQARNAARVLREQQALAASLELMAQQAAARRERLIQRERAEWAKDRAHAARWMAAQGVAA